MKEILLSPLGGVLILFVRGLLAALFICGGIQSFDFKNISSFFTCRKVIGLFLLIIGVRILINVLFFFDICRW